MSDDSKYPKVARSVTHPRPSCWYEVTDDVPTHKVVPVDAQVFEAGEKVLVIRRDENGEWPAWAIRAAIRAKHHIHDPDSPALDWQLGEPGARMAAADVLDALEGGQG